VTQNNSQLDCRYFRFAGLLLAKAIYDCIVYAPVHLNVHFTRSFYKMILGGDVTYRDLETDTPDLFASQVTYLLKHDISSSDLELYFEEMEILPNGSVAIEPLRPNGGTIPVTQHNKKEYIQALADHKLRTTVSKEIEAFLGGFYSLLPEDLVSIFDERELELLISGMPNISAKDILNFIKFTGFSPRDREPEWFSTSVESFSSEELARLLQFMTGSSQIPNSGFAFLNPPLRVKLWRSKVDHLPRASTCFNTIILPRYSSYEKLRQQLLISINEGNEGFAFS
jgi:hypothetical protein